MEEVLQRYPEIKAEDYFNSRNKPLKRLLGFAGVYASYPDESLDRILYVPSDEEAANGVLPSLRLNIVKEAFEVIDVRLQDLSFQLVGASGKVLLYVKPPKLTQEEWSEIKRGFKDYSERMHVQLSNREYNIRTGQLDPEYLDFTRTVKKFESADEFFRTYGKNTFAIGKCSENQYCTELVLSHLVADPDNSRNLPKLQRK